VPAPSLRLLVVLVDDQLRFGHACDPAVVDELDAPGAVLEIVRREIAVGARALVERLARAVDGFIGP